VIALLQRVSRSSVRIDAKEVAKIGRGVTIFLGVMDGDTIEDLQKLADKIVDLRIFPDERGRMHYSLKQIEGEALVVSQFTLAADLKRGRRPSFERAMEPNGAKRLYELFCERMGESVDVQRGVFGASMEVEIHNDGPVTIIVDSREI